MCSQTMKRNTFESVGAASTLAVAALLFWCMAPAGKAQPPDVGSTRTLQGAIERFTTAPMGEIDGAVLDDGTVIHWAPHLADRFSGIAARGEPIRATGWTVTGPEGDTHFEIRTLTNRRTNAFFENNDPAPPPPRSGPGRRRGSLPPPRPQPERRLESNPLRSVQGRVARLTTAPMGEVDGAVLDDGTVVHWPPHLSAQFAATVTRGAQVRFNGWTEIGPEADSHFEVQSASNIRTDSASGNVPAPRSSIDREGDRSSDFASASGPNENLERRMKALEDQIAQLREEIRLLRGGR